MQYQVPPRHQAQEGICKTEKDKRDETEIVDRESQMEEDWYIQKNTKDSNIPAFKEA